jgi:hypothetical protein
MLTRGLEQKLPTSANGLTPDKLAADEDYI